MPGLLALDAISENFGFSVVPRYQRNHFIDRHPPAHIAAEFAQRIKDANTPDPALQQAQQMEFQAKLAKLGSEAYRNIADAQLKLEKANVEGQKLDLQEVMHVLDFQKQRMNDVMELQMARETNATRSKPA